MTARRSSSHLLIPLTPTDDAHATSKKYVDDEIEAVVASGGVPFYIADSEPSGPGPYFWVQVDGSGNFLDIIVGSNP